MLLENKYWEALAPSNIALIKYVGKKSADNQPISPSLSYTLDHLVSVVRIQALSPREKKDGFQALEDFNITELKKCFRKQPAIPMRQNSIQVLSKHTLKHTSKQTIDKQNVNKEKVTKIFPYRGSKESINRFLIFFSFLKKAFYLPGFYLIQSGNNFPAGVGCASSASSFCALTLATHKVALDCSLQKQKVKNMSLEDLSALSRVGSGSACRSMFRPWALWEQKHATSIDIPFLHLTHQLILTSDKEKPVSSSIAHKRVRTSPFFKGRIERAETRLKNLIVALRNKNWRQCFDICWDEFQDLHQLYETSTPPIYYRNETSLAIIKKIKDIWDTTHDGPLITMDAGSAVHLLYRPSQKLIRLNDIS